jgi:transcriptional regulator with XRE-family HTH domain
VPSPRFRRETLLAARERAGITRSELGRLIGDRDGARVRSWETGLDQPRPSLIPALAEALDVSPLALLDVDEAAPPLRAVRIAAGLTLTELARRAEVTYGVCQRLDAGRMIPSDESSVARVAGVLGLSVEELKAAARRP